VDAQQARRILDRLVGYKVRSDPLGEGAPWPLRGAGPVVALRLICDREREIRAFVPEEYWTVLAHLEGQKPPVFPANLLKRDGKSLEIGNGEESGDGFAPTSSRRSSGRQDPGPERKRNPVPPSSRRSSSRRPSASSASR